MRDVLVAAALGFALLPGVWTLLKPAVFRELTARPLLALMALACGLMAVWWLLPLVPGRLAAFAIPVIAAVDVLFYLRSRADYGRSRGLPPGSLGLGNSLDAIDDPTFYARAARRWGPVFKMSQFQRPVACIVDLPLGLEIMESQRANLAQPRLPFGRLSPGNYIEFMQDEQHARYRGILKSALSGPVVTDSRPGVRSVMQHELSAWAERDRGQGSDPDPVLERISFASLVRVVFGIAADDPRVDELEQSFAALGSARMFLERRPEQRQEPYNRLVGIVRDFGTGMLADRATGADPPPRSLLGEILKTDPAQLGDDTLIGNLVLIVHVTRSNIRGLLGWVLKEYCDHPEFGLEIREAASGTTTATASVGALAGNFVNETLRLHQSEYFYREVKHPISIGPYRIPRGWLLRVCVRECHDNPDVFPHPEQFDPKRFAGRHYTKGEYCPFSDGSHSCFGAGLAVMIANTLVTVLATGFQVRGVADGPVVRQGNRHWSHWRPSLAFRVAVSLPGAGTE